MPITPFDQGWVLETRSTAYALHITAHGRVAHLYWGPRLPRTDDYCHTPNPAAQAIQFDPDRLTPEEYPAHGGLHFAEPCLVATFADGVRDVVLRFEAAQIRSDADTPQLDVVLRDPHYPLRVTLHYRVHEACDVIERWSTIGNEGTETLTLHRALSAQWHFPPGDSYRLTHVGGRWADEMHLRHDVLTPGVKRLESRRGLTSFAHNPWFALDRGDATEDHGEVWFGALAWSGNWTTLAEVTELQATRLSAGINDWDFAWTLDGGESFVTPGSYAGYTEQGFGAASRALHDLIRDRFLPHGHRLHRILYNSWEATMFAVDETSQMKLADLAAQLGIELFVMDDGWFHGRNWDNAGLGDWWPDEAKFPRGLKPLIDHVKALGMDSGLWIEPEAVNPDSDLYRARPDWTLHFPTRPGTQWRNQLTLNLARGDVQDYLIETLDRLLSENDISFIKWDMNREISEAGWPAFAGDGREVWVRYVRGLYRVWGTLRERHPDVIFQSCAGGGGRADVGMLRLADQIWVSDNTEASARLRIQDSFSRIFPASVMEAWVTDAGAPGVPLAFRFHVSMCGSLGVGGNLLKWAEADRAAAARLIADYKTIRPIVQLGDQYRLLSPQDSNFAAVQYISKDRSDGVLFAFRTHLPEPVRLPLIYLRGLDADALYRVEGAGAARSGAAWMQTGLALDLMNWQSTLRRITRVAG